MTILKSAIKTIGLVGLISVSGAVSADVAVGKVSDVLVSGDGNSVHFKLDPMPAGVTQWFSVDDKRDYNHECRKKGSQSAVYLITSTVTTLKLNQGDAEVSYCLAINGTGIVNVTEGYVRMK